MSLTVGLISLGCPKNLIDSEIMIGHLQKAGMTMTPDAELADVMVVNTCAFIDQAKQEAIDAILDVVRARESGTYPENQKLIVAGCLSQRFHKELPALLPEVDAFIGPDQITRLPEIITEVMNRTVRNKKFRGRQMQVRSGLGNAALPPDASPQRLYQDSGRLQPRMRLLHYSDDPRTPPQPLPGGRGA